MDRKDLYWLAGLLEGEGSFQKPAPCEPKYPRITIKMTNRDIIERVAALFERNYIHTRKHSRLDWKDSHGTLVKGKRPFKLCGNFIH